MEETGQIQLGTPFGDHLYSLCAKNPAVKTVVEIGTWKGLGSTKCIMQGLSDSGKDGVSFFSLEAEKGMHETACRAWQDTLPPWAHLIHGRIVERTEMDSADLGSGHPDEERWFKQDESAFESCPNVLNSLPDTIDFLFLDGGEFSTYSEYTKLKNRSQFIGMDDSTQRKCRRIREEILSDSDRYEILIDNPWYRNGVLICRNRNHQ